jgi:hypothetical protein
VTLKRLLNSPSSILTSSEVSMLWQHQHDITKKERTRLVARAKAKATVRFTILAMFEHVVITHCQG